MKPQFTADALAAEGGPIFESRTLAAFIVLGRIADEVRADLGEICARRRPQPEWAPEVTAEFARRAASEPVIRTHPWALRAWLRSIPAALVHLDAQALDAEYQALIIDEEL